VLKTFSGRNPSQDEFELRSFIALLLERGVRSYLEIGARDGDTFHEVMGSMPAGARGVALDLPGGLWGRTTTRARLERACADLERRGYKAAPLFGDSRAAGTLRLAHTRGPYDAMLIDGDHTYEGVRSDWENYRHMAPLVAFHDIVGDGQAEKVHGRPVEVPRLWGEIKASGAQTVEFVAPGSTMGIGVVVQR
jgi:hypothetical protein